MVDLNNALRGKVRIKNVSGADYFIEELGDHQIADQEELDIMDPTLPSYYNDWEAANRLVTALTGAKLYQDIQAGDIEVVLNQPPMG